MGGIKEKILAARRARIRRVILPALNERDLEDVNEKLRADMEFVFVDRIEEVFKEALVTANESLLKPGIGNKRKAARKTIIRGSKSTPKRAPRRRGR